LAGVLSVADALITRNSTVAIDALVLGLPAVVIGRPSNLSPFVDEGVMTGVNEPGNADRIAEALERLLYDRDVRTTVTAAADAFVDRYGLRPMPTSAARAADVILEMARR